MIDILDTHKIILASKSPRRKEIMTLARIPFTLIESDWEETYDSEMDVYQVPQYLSYQKADSVKVQISEKDILISADTVVIKNGQLIGKPIDKSEAENTLRDLSGDTHDVITGVTIMSYDKTINISCKSVVHFMSMTDDEISFYIKEYHPFDKAGSYGIQDWVGLCKIKSIEGSYHNIMGLPIHMVYSILSSW